MKQLARVSEREYLFTNNPLITSDGQRDQTWRATQELNLNETGLKIPASPPCVAIKTFAVKSGTYKAESEIFSFAFTDLLIIKRSGRCDVNLRGGKGRN